MAAWWQHRALPVAARTAPPAYCDREWMRVAAPLFAVTGLSMLLTRLDVVLVGSLVGATRAGEYVLAARTAQLASFGLIASNLAVGPAVAQLHVRGDRERLQRAATHAARIAVAVALVAVLVVVLGRPVLEWLTGRDYTQVWSLLVILTAGQVVNAVTGPVGPLLDLTGHQDWNAAILLATVLLSLVLGYLAIGAWGLYGAAFVTAGMIGLRNLVSWAVVRRKLGVDSSVLGWKA
jgi:O-antigen/teichoic acid export membrane protein